MVKSCANPAVPLGSLLKRRKLFRCDGEDVMCPCLSVPDHIGQSKTRSSVFCWQ